MTHDYNWYHHFDDKKHFRVRLAARHRYNILKSMEIDVHVWAHTFPQALSVVMDHYVNAIFRAEFEWTQWVISKAEIIRYKDRSSSLKGFLMLHARGQTPDSEVSLAKARKQKPSFYQKLSTFQLPPLAKELKSLSRRGWRGTFADAWGERYRVKRTDLMVSHLKLQELKENNTFVES
jgi:hypothetical protein